MTKTQVCRAIGEMMMMADEMKAKGDTTGSESLKLTYKGKENGLLRAVNILQKAQNESEAELAKKYEGTGL